MCNSPLKEGEIFCKNCGTPVTKKQRAFNTVSENPIIKPLSVWDFILMIILKYIPVVNIIVFLIWAFGSCENINRKSYARAVIIFAVVQTVILTVAAIVAYPYYSQFI